ncbi:hypothetical protein RhiirA5_362758 [Rhizophagus irregularis]|uniref:Uncharacterized protein n=1 Tax=Rhizophagus irregularis TaxID=588596 RepID=A0A2N0RNK0_9GLOM|nr:hypothetical protein RhiirA5_362758 [Rhizophagus irregularis]PKC64878.1 hypothetical protein RhiirA1_421065 [Rhizophagus irregularis]CAB4470613.1 unnamed protein product [Rhizophagus irregularis]
MLSSKVISFITFFVVIIAVVLSVTSAPVAAPVDADEANGNQTILQSDSVPVSSDGGNITLYSNDDAKKIPENVVDKGNSAKGDGKGQ